MNISFLDFLKEKQVIEQLFNFYHLHEKKPYELNKIKIFVRKIIEEVQEIDNWNGMSERTDRIGFIYTNKVSYEKRKKKGEIYTPKSVVNMILNATNYKATEDISNKKIIDLSCGSGSFLLETTTRLILNSLLSFNVDNISDLSFEQCKLILNSIKDNIYGIDINPMACILCQINFHYKLFTLYVKIIKNVKDFEIPVYNILNSNSITLIDKKSKLLSGNFGKFDFVFGNPPYLFIREIPKSMIDSINNSRLETKKGQYDLYQFFLELGIKILKDEGILGYIIPDSFLALSNRKIIRRFIYLNTEIIEISIVGSKFDSSSVSNIIIILKKQQDKQKRERNIVNVNNFKNIQTKSHSFRQERIKIWNYKFLINLNERDMELLKRLNQSFHKLKDLKNNNNYHISLNRGVELSKKGQIIFCANCKKYIPIPNRNYKCSMCGGDLEEIYKEKIIVKKLDPTLSQEEYKPFIYSINRYHITEKRYINIKKPGINYKNLDIYENNILIRQLNQGNLICAAYNGDIALNSQSFYNLKIKSSITPEFNNLFLLGLLNSHLLSYFFIKSFGSYKQLFPRILIEKIYELPIKIPSNSKEKTLAKSIRGDVELILQMEKANRIQVSKIQKRLDKNVYDLYNINPSNRKYIEDLIPS
ncbi:MAG: N-6 DNA methylase [Candidatus Lokiarchaeota archaeon]|nr:N-6 DNA methylase [Candidatus Lokiarchaeota archaeon]MBD3199556.1 N-6 DNA methylase [Candidatus Lokiarchaeota archaeon]